MTNLKLVLGVVLAAATLALVLPPFMEGLTLVFPGVKAPLAQFGIVPGTEPKLMAPVFGIIATVLAASAFAVSWKQNSSLVTGLLILSGISYIIGASLATIYLFGTVVPGPILGVISGIGMLGLGVATAIRTARAAIVDVLRS